MVDEENVEFAGTVGAGSPGAASGATSTGAVLLLKPTAEAEPVVAWGTWAVTG
jgi:hypothetical protein